MKEIRRPAATAEQLTVARATSQLRRQFVHTESAEGAVERDPRSREPVSAQIGSQRKRVLGLRERVQVPAVQLAELLAKVSYVEAHAPGQAGPIGISLLDADIAVLEAHEDLGAGVGIEWRLESPLELPRVEVVPVHTWRVAIRSHVARRADLGVELRLAALASDEPRGPAGVATDFRGVHARRGRCGGAQRRELVGRRGVPGGRRARCAPELCPQTIEARLEGADLRRKRVHPTLLCGLLG